MSLFGIALLAFLSLVGVAIAAAILRAACWLCGVQEPGLLRAMGIVLLVVIVQALVGLPMGLVMVTVGMSYGADPRKLQMLASLAGLPAAILITAALYMSWLDTNFAKGMLVSLTQILITLVLGIGALGLYLLLSRLLLGDG